MKVLYVLGAGSRHENWEIRWSLRSLVKHVRNFEPVVVGTIPDCLDRGKIECHAWNDRFNTKHKNILSHILRAVDCGVVGGEFLYSSDDHFFVKGADFDRYPIWMQVSPLPKEADYGDIPIGKYRRSILDTRQVLEEFGHSVHQFHGHFNTHMHCDDAEAVRAMAEVEPSARYGYEPTELFMNARTARESFDAVTRTDLKIGEFVSPAALAEAVGDNDSFSVADSAFVREYREGAQTVVEDSGFFDFMSKLYPDKSEFER